MARTTKLIAGPAQLDEVARKYKADITEHLGAVASIMTQAKTTHGLDVSFSVTPDGQGGFQVGSLFLTKQF